MKYVKEKKKIRNEIDRNARSEKMRRGVKHFDYVINQVILSLSFSLFIFCTLFRTLPFVILVWVLFATLLRSLPRHCFSMTNSKTQSCICQDISAPFQQIFRILQSAHRKWETQQYNPYKGSCKLKVNWTLFCPFFIHFSNFVSYRFWLMLSRGY